jgi:hypothetical protein
MHDVNRKASREVKRAKFQKNRCTVDANELALCRRVRPFNQVDNLSLIAIIATQGEAKL